MVKLYVLAHYLQATTIGNRVMDYVSRSVYWQTVDFTFSSAVMSLAYSSTVEGCGLRRFLVAGAV